jgi:hypothetical protein
MAMKKIVNHTTDDERKHAVYAEENQDSTHWQKRNWVKCS